MLIDKGMLAGPDMAVGAGVTPDWPIAWMFVALTFGELLRSLPFAALTTLAIADLPLEKLSAGTGPCRAGGQLRPALGIVLATPLAGIEPVFSRP